MLDCHAVQVLTWLILFHQFVYDYSLNISTLQDLVNIFHTFYIKQFLSRCQDKLKIVSERSLPLGQGGVVLLEGGARCTLLENQSILPLQTRPADYIGVWRTCSIPFISSLLSVLMYHIQYQSIIHLVNDVKYCIAILQNTEAVNKNNHSESF